MVGYQSCSMVSPMFQTSFSFCRRHQYLIQIPVEKPERLFLDKFQICSDLLHMINTEWQKSTEIEMHAIRSYPAHQFHICDNPCCKITPKSSFSIKLKLVLTWNLGYLAAGFSWIDYLSTMLKSQVMNLSKTVESCTLFLFGHILQIRASKTYTQHPYQ